MNPFCLICHDTIAPKVTWTSIFTRENETFLCPTCEERLIRIEGDTCRICHRPFQTLAEQFRKDDLCNDCVRWEEDPDWAGFLDKNEAIFQYNDFLKEVIAQYKFRGDYLLSKLFAESVRPKLKTMQADQFVPIPLSNERLYERGFNQAEAILVGAGYTPSNILTRIHGEKQSKKTRSERIDIPQVFLLSGEVKRKIVLIDDVYTTGSTLRHAAKLLKQVGAEFIQSMTLAR